MDIDAGIDVGVDAGLVCAWSGTSSGYFVWGLVRVLVRALVRVLVRVFLWVGLNVVIQTIKLWCRWHICLLYVVSMVFNARCVQDLNAMLGRVIGDNKMGR